MVMALTDNKNRTASAVRSAFSHSGGSLGASGSVSYMFDRKGLIEILRDGLDKSEDDMLMDALDAGADDMQATDEKFQIFTDPSSMTSVRDALQDKGYELDTAEVTMIPQNRTAVPADKAKQYRHLIDELTANDDVADIYETGILPDDADDDEE
jgi:YebC/PmpR family DNA-binding regulatory protein